jgi:hypothetical protein
MDGTIPPVSYTSLWRVFKYRDKFIFFPLHRFRGLNFSLADLVSPMKSEHTKKIQYTETRTSLERPFHFFGI